MTKSGGHIRQVDDARSALDDAIALYRRICEEGLKVGEKRDLAAAVRAEHMALASVGYLKAVLELLKQGSGSRGSHLVLDQGGLEIHPDVTDKATGKPLRYKPENESLRKSILEVRYDESSADLFSCDNVPLRAAPSERKSFEPAWRDYRGGEIYGS